MDAKIDDNVSINEQEFIDEVIVYFDTINKSNFYAPEKYDELAQLLEKHNKIIKNEERVINLFNKIYLVYEFDDWQETIYHEAVNGLAGFCAPGRRWYLSEAKNLLLKAGWHERRSIEVEDIIEGYKSKSYPLPNDLMQQMFKEFWNIHIKTRPNNEVYKDIRLSTSAALSMVTKEAVDKFSEMYKDILLPVGTVYSDSVVLWLSYAGKFYIGNKEGELNYIGNDIVSMIETLIC